MDVVVETKATTTAVIPDPTSHESKLICLQHSMFEVNLVRLHYQQRKKTQGNDAQRSRCNFLLFWVDITRILWL